MIMDMQGTVASMWYMPICNSTCIYNVHVTMQSAIITTIVASWIPAR